MIKYFIYHKWKESVRSTVFQKNLIINIFLGLFIIYLLLSFATLGFFIDVILEKSFPDQNPIYVFNGFLLFYFGFELVMRLQLQELPVMAVQPYMHLPISKKKIIHYLLSQNLISFFNFLPLLISVPFAVKAILPTYGILGLTFWLASATLVSILLSYLVAYVKMQMTQFFWIAPILIGIIAITAFLDYQGFFELTAISKNIFTYAIESPLVLIVLIASLSLTYFLNYKLVLDNTYLDEITNKSKKRDTLSNFTFFERFGLIGQLLSLEIKLILRNKRSKSVATTSAIFIFYGLIFYTNDIYLEGHYMLMFAGVFITGMFLMNYGQFIPSWESTFFDNILTRGIDSREYFLSKYYLFLPTCIFSFILSLPYAYFGWKVVAINFVMLLFNIGVNALVILYFATFNDRRIDLSKRAVLNWEGVGASQFIMMIPALLLPLLLFFPFDYFLQSPQIGYAFLGGISLVNLLFHRYWIKLIASRFEKQKYKIAAGLRKE